MTGEMVENGELAEIGGWEGRSVKLSERGTVVLDNAYEFPLDIGAASNMVWRPASEGQPTILTGVLGGELDFEWKPGEKTRYYVLHSQSGDGSTFSWLISQWYGVKRGLDGIEVGDEIVIVHRGLKQLASGRSFHDIVIGRPIGN